MIFSGSSNHSLAHKLSKKLKVPVGRVDLSRFANDEARVWIRESRVPEKVIVVQSLSIPTDHHLVEFGLLVDALYRLGAKKITAIIPWLGYSKQDKVFRKGDPLSAKVVAKMLSVVPLDRIITLDLHNLAISGFFEVPVTNLSAKELFVKHFNKLPKAQVIVVAPDAGAIKASTSFAQALKVPVAYINKKRDLATGKVSIVGISGVGLTGKKTQKPLKGMKAIVVDDIVATGETLIGVSRYLKRIGAESVEVAITHHLYVPGVQTKITKSAIDSLVVTDTIAMPKENKNNRKLKVLSVAGLLAEKIQ